MAFSRYLRGEESCDITVISQNRRADTKFSFAVPSASRHLEIVACELTERVCAVHWIREGLLQKWCAIDVHSYLKWTL